MVKWCGWRERENMLMIFPQLKVIELRFCNDTILPAAFGINYDTSV